MAFGRNQRGRQSHRDKLIENKRALDFMADAVGKPRMQFEIPPPPKKRAPRDSEIPLEKEVLADVLQALRCDPRVALVDRRQSGTFMDGDRYIKVGVKGTLDISGMLHGGRYFEIECKRPGGKPDTRQWERIAGIVANGGIAGCATSADEALALLP